MKTILDTPPPDVSNDLKKLAVDLDNMIPPKKLRLLRIALRAGPRPPGDPHQHHHRRQKRLGHQAE